MTVLDDADSERPELREQVLRQLRQWFGAKVADWRELRTYRIRYALPKQNPPALSPVEKPARRTDGVFVCGDHMDTASLQGAMASGRRAAEAVLEQLT